MLFQTVIHLLILIPCHRIVHASGKIGEYRGGIEKKW
jgi:O6-methylguanine-DNA--protein-cysteine methyltransferase